MQAGRPLTAFCACELRSPAPFTEQGFRAFNESYVVTLQKWGLFDGKVNPVARSNVCPEIDPPSEPCFYAFSFTAAAGADAAPSFVIAGSAARAGLTWHYARPPVQELEYEDPQEPWLQATAGRPPTRPGGPRSLSPTAADHHREPHGTPPGAAQPR